MVKLEDFKVTEIRDLVRKYNKRVKIVGMSKLNKTDLIKAIRQHPRITVVESDKGVKLEVSGEVSGTNEKKIKIKKDTKEEPEKKRKQLPEIPGPKPPPKRKLPAQPRKSKMPPKPEPKKKVLPKTPTAKLGQSGVGQKRKREDKPSKKKVIQVPATYEPTDEDFKQLEKPKKKVIKKGGRFVSINQPKKKESVEEQVKKALAQSDKKIEKEKKKPKPPADDAERIPDMVQAIEKARKKGQPAKGLELQLKELMRDFDLSGFKLPGQKDKADKPKEEKPKEEKPKKKKKKETTIQRIRRQRAEAIEKDKGKVIPQVSDLPKKAQTEFFKYLKEENENGFTLEDQSDLYEYMEDLADRLPKERKARQELNQFDKEQLVLFEALFPKEYIKHIDVENDFTGRKEKLVAAQEKKAASEEARSQKIRDKESRAIAKKMEKQKQSDIKQKEKDQKEYKSYIKKNPFKN